MDSKQKQKLLSDFFIGQKENISKARSRTASTSGVVDEPSTYVKKRRSYVRDDSAQYTLDAGQKTIGTQFCEKCNMVFDCDSVTDCNLHVEYHDRFTKRDWFRVKYSQIDLWRKQNICVCVDDGYLFLVDVSTKSSLKHRLEEVILKCVNVEIGFPPDLSCLWSESGKRQLWSFIASSSKFKFPFIAAVILVEGIDQAFSIDEKDGNQQKTVFDRWFMGVNRIWVHKSLRRSGIATKLLDEVRRNMRRDCIIPRDRVAFSELTDDGEAFAKSFCKMGRILRFSLISKKA